MDQLRKVMVWLKQYHFWVLSVLIAFIALGCWKIGAAALRKEFEANKTTIKGAFDSQTSFQSKPFHPNDDVNEKQLNQIKLQSENVAAIWTALYERQSKSVLNWPEALGDKFRDFVAKRRFGDPIPRDLRDTYRDYIDRHFESLPKRISARPMAENEQSGFGGGEGMTRGMMRGNFRGEGGPSFRMTETGATNTASQDDDYLCEWLDQGLVRQELDFPTTPSAMKIWVTQENLWVYHTLLDIIANTNEAANADRMTNAAVRTIVALEVGRPAAIASMERGRVEILQAPAAAPVEGASEFAAVEGGGEQRPMMEPGMGERYNPGGEGGGGINEEQEKAMLVESRYLDPATGKPAGMAAAAAPVDGGDPAAAAAPAAMPTGPYKQLPIRMVLKMDQRWLTHLISECASQPLPVEVKEVRINPPGVQNSGGGEGYRGGGGSMTGDGGNRSTYQPPALDAVGGGAATFKQHPELATVVIQGIVTIYNEPDPTQLKVHTGEQVAVAE